MNVLPEHVFNPDDPDVVGKFTAIVDKERDDLNNPIIQKSR